MPLTPTTGYVHPGELFVCNCGIPLARKTKDQGYELLKLHNGKSIKIQVTFGSMIQVKCPVCGRGFAHLRVSDSIQVRG